MKIFRQLDQLPKFKNSVITVGSFDGIHIGHQKLFNRINQLADEINGESIVITLHPHPRQVIYPNDKELVLLNSLDEKIDLLTKQQVDNLVIVPFSIEFSQIGAREYIEKFLIGHFNPKFIVVGYDHSFGKNREGSFELLKTYEEKAGFKLIKIEKQQLENIAISSTKIRTAIQACDIATANNYLDYYYPLTGTVIKGNQVGAGLGFPTANIQIEDKNKLVPPNGIYAAKTEVDGETYRSMLYIGNRPSFENSNERTIEVNLFDFNNQIYGEKIKVCLVDFIRSDVKYDSIEDLRKQLAKDKEAALEILDLHDSLKKDIPLVTLAILNYNGQEYLDSYLPSVLHSSDTYSNQIVCIDNNSKDNSIELLEDYFPEVILQQLSKNYGFAEGYNKGIQQIDSKYTVLLNSDVQVTMDWLDPIISYMEQNSDVGVCQPKILSLENKDEFEYAGASGGFIDHLGYPFARGRIFSHLEKDEGQYDDPKEIFWASGAAMVIRTDLFKSIGGFDPSYFAHMEEIDLCWRIKKAGYKAMVIPKSKVYHLGGGTLEYQNPNKTYLNFRNNLLTLLKNDSTGNLLYKFPLRLLLDWVASIKFLFEGNLKHSISVLKAHLYILGMLFKIGGIRKKWRTKIEEVRIAESRENSGKKNFSIVLSHFILGKKKFTEL